MLIYFRTKFQTQNVKVILRTYLASDYMLYRAYILQFQSTLFCDIKYDLLIRLISNFGRLVQFVDFFFKVGRCKGRNYELYQTNLLSSI